MTNRGLSYPGNLADPKRCPWSQITAAGAVAFDQARDVRTFGRLMAWPDLGSAPAPVIEAIRLVEVTLIEIQEERSEAAEREERERQRRNQAQG